MTSPADMTQTRDALRTATAAVERARRQLRTSAPEHAAQLTPRETQVLGFAAMGHHTKLIAYELGISDSTVRVLLSRARAKLGARSRQEAVAAAGLTAPSSTQDTTPSFHDTPVSVDETPASTRDEPPSRQDLRPPRRDVRPSRIVAAASSLDAPPSSRDGRAAGLDAPLAFQDGPSSFHDMSASSLPTLDLRPLTPTPTPTDRLRRRRPSRLSRRAGDA